MWPWSTAPVIATDAVDAGATLITRSTVFGTLPITTFNSNGSYGSFNASANAAYQSLGVGQQTIITVPYTVTDNTGATSTAQPGHHGHRYQRCTCRQRQHRRCDGRHHALTITPATLLGNDTDIDSGTTLSITSVQGAVNGTVALVGGNVVSHAGGQLQRAGFVHLHRQRRQRRQRVHGHGHWSMAAVNDALVAQATLASRSPKTRYRTTAPSATGGFSDVGRRFTLPAQRRGPAGPRSTATARSFNPATRAYQSLGVGQQTI